MHVSQYPAALQKCLLGPSDGTQLCKKGYRLQRLRRTTILDRQSTFSKTELSCISVGMRKRSLPEAPGIGLKAHGTVLLQKLTKQGWSCKLPGKETVWEPKKKAALSSLENKWDTGAINNSNLTNSQLCTRNQNSKERMSLDLVHDCKPSALSSMWAHIQCKVELMSYLSLHRKTIPRVSKAGKIHQCK